MITAPPAALLVFRHLRTPCARPCFLAFNFSREGLTNVGYTLNLPEGEPTVAAGDGQVEAIRLCLPNWQYDSPNLGGQPTYEITVSHGAGVKTLVAGLASPSVNFGQTVHRGDLLGSTLANQIHFRILLLDIPLNPASVSRHFGAYEERWVIGGNGIIRFAPDKLVRVSGTTARFYSRLRYFQDLTPDDYLINVDFHGSGAKTGWTATGLMTTDFWNVYSRSGFVVSGVFSCGYGLVFSSDPTLWLNDYQGVRTSVWIEKYVEPASPYYGSLGHWDPMLATWLGGIHSQLGKETYFGIRGLPVGEYRIYLYGSPGSTRFEVTVNAEPTVVQSTVSTLATTFVQGSNYVRFDLTVPFLGIVYIQTFGYLSGMQIQRV